MKANVNSAATGVFIALTLMGPLHAHAQTPTWWRGNLHVHTLNSDGAAPPDTVTKWYRENDYHFVVISDHNMLTPVGELNERYGAAGEFLVLAGVEVSDRFERRPVHLNAIGVTSAVLPTGGATVPAVIDSNVVAIRSAGGLAQLNHPNGLLRAALTPAEVVAANHLTHFEVCCADYRGGGGVASTEEIWDHVLTAGEQLYGTAADDAHSFDPKDRQPGTAWVMVRAPELTRASLLDALGRGEFYATTGVNLADYRAHDGEMQIELADTADYRYRTFFIGADGAVLKRDDSFAPSYTLTSADRYVRARIERSDGATAWTQPLFNRP